MNEIERWKTFREQIEQQRGSKKWTDLGWVLDPLVYSMLGWVLDRIDEQLRELGVDTDHG